MEKAPQFLPCSRIYSFPFYLPYFFKSSPSGAAEHEKEQLSYAQSTEEKTVLLLILAAAKCEKRGC